MHRQTGPRRSRRVLLIATVGLAIAGCHAGARPPEAAEAALLPGGISVTMQAAFDSASSALEAGDTERARILFSAVLAQDSTLAAAWIGLHLSSGPGTVPDDTALKRARSLIEPPPLVRGRSQTKPAT